MLPIVPLTKYKQEQRLIPTQVRLPKWARDKAQEIAQAQSQGDTKVTETDVYRTAILSFLSLNSTDSRVSEVEPTP